MATSHAAGDRGRQAARSLAEGVFHGDRRAVARAISQVEDHTPLGRGLLEAIYPRTGAARRIGITGPPGSGKSTLVNVLCRLLRARGHRVGVLAVDPTSPFTGGAILGDRIRMPAATGDEGLFVRSMASRGSLGGVAATTYEASEVLEAAGFDRILIETVGVGQSELEVVELADTTVLLLVPESGDAVQTMKAGVMEVADIFVVNKFDREGGDRLVRAIEATLELANRSRHWRPPVCAAVAVREEGIEEVLAQIDQHFAWLSGDGNRLERVRSEKVERRLRALLNHRLLAGVWAVAQLEDRLAEAVERIVAREISPYQWVESVRETWLPREED